MSPQEKPLPPLLPVNLSRQYNINRDPTLAMKAAVFSPLVYVLSHGFLFVPKGFIVFPCIKWLIDGQRKEKNSVTGDRVTHEHDTEFRYLRKEVVECLVRNFCWFLNFQDAPLMSYYN